jgi:hypothetical protein
MKSTRSLSLIFLFLLPCLANADLTSNLLAYYTFEETGATGLANKAPGATSFDATREGTLFTDWATGDNPTGPGFAGKADFTATTSGVSDRSDLHVGNSLNLDEDHDEYIRLPISSADLGVNFTISAWHALTPGVANTSTRYHTFETETGFDVSWGTANTTFTTPQTSYPYLAYIGEGPSGGFGPSSVASQAWHHVAYSVSSDGTTSTLRLYVDGQFLSSRTIATSLIDFAALLFGRQRTSTAGDRDWDGMIDEVALWNRTLHANEVTDIYQRGNAGLSLNADLASAGKAFLDIRSSDPVMGDSFGTGLYDLNEEVTIQADAKNGYVFVDWTSPFATQTDFFSHTVIASLSATANFTQDIADNDNDGLTNYQEIVIYNTDPELADTDGDLINDPNEINQSLSNPLVSQTTAINYIIANLSGGPSPNDILLNRNTSNNTLSFYLELKDSENLNTWNVVAPSSPGLNISIQPAGLLVSSPGNSATKRFLRFEAKASETE